MVNEKLTDRQQRLEKFLQSVEAAQKLQDDIMNYGLDAAYLCCDDVDGDWLEKWGEEEEKDSYIESLTIFLQSEDSVAVKVRQQLLNKSTGEIIEQLEECLSLATEEDRIFAVKNVLIGSVVSRESNRDASNNDYNEIEILDLAEELLEKLSEILGSNEIG